MPDTVIRRAARALNPDQPLRALAERVRRPRSTVKSWTTGRRRPPIWALTILREMLKGRQSAVSQLVGELDYIIAQRQSEPSHRTGFCTIDPTTGRDKRNRLGRPRKAFSQ